MNRRRAPSAPSRLFGDGVQGSRNHANPPVCHSAITRTRDVVLDVGHRGSRVRGGPVANGGSNAVPNAVAPRAAAGYQQVQANGPALAGWCNRARRERRPHATCAPHGALILLRRDRRPALNSTRGCPRSGRPPTSSGERPSVSWPVEPCPTRTTSPCDLRATWRLDIASPRPLSRIEFDPRVCCQRVHHVAHATRSPGWPLTRADGGSNAAPNAVALRAAAGYQQGQANGPASAGR